MLCLPHLTFRNFSLRQYDHEGNVGGGNVGRSIRSIPRPNERHGGPSSAVSRSPDFRADHHHKSPHEILAASGSVEAVRNRNVQGLLYDFFGM
jgi:hypothetical protein